MWIYKTRVRRAGGGALRADQGRRHQRLVEDRRRSRRCRTRYGITGTVYYGYRAWGPNWPYNSELDQGLGTGFITDVDASGNRFNPNKLLIDPYARGDQPRPDTPPTCTDGTIYASGADRTATRTAAPCAPKGIVLAPITTSIGTKPTRALQGRRRLRSARARPDQERHHASPRAYRGTYAGAALKAGYLASLGVTAVEFLPVQETQNDTNDVDPDQHQRATTTGAT